MGTLLNVGAFFSGRVQNGFETQNGFTRSGFRGIPSLVPKFAFLVVEIGLRKPPQFENFSEIEALHKVMAHFFSGWVQRVLGASSMFLRGTFVHVKFFAENCSFSTQKRLI